MQGLRVNGFRKLLQREPRRQQSSGNRKRYVGYRHSSFDAKPGTVAGDHDRTGANAEGEWSPSGGPPSNTLRAFKRDFARPAQWIRDRREVRANEEGTTHRDFIVIIVTFVISRRGKVTTVTMMTNKCAGQIRKERSGDDCQGVLSVACGRSYLHYARDKKGTSLLCSP